MRKVADAELDDAEPLGELEDASIMATEPRGVGPVLGAMVPDADDGSEVDAGLI